MWESKTTSTMDMSELAKALVKLQGMLPKVTKDKNNPYFKSKYADLASIIDVIQEPMAKCGLAIINTMDYDEMFPDSILIRTTLLHESGQYISGCTKMQVATKDKHPTPQEIGSMITYGRRYGIAALLGLAAEDDDGALASGTVKPQRSTTYEAKEETKKPIEIAKEVFEGAQEVTLDLLKEEFGNAGIDVGKVLKHFKVENLEDLTPEQMTKALAKVRKGGK